jgi:hypothetical protein
MTADGGKMVWGGSTIKWYLHPAGSADVPFADCKNALAAAFQAWDSVSCLTKSFSDGGSKNSDPEDGIYIKFKESNWDPTVGDAAAYAQSWTNWSGKISNSTITFNGVDLTWTTTEAVDYFSAKSDIQGVATHEIGHCLGLDHSREQAATMFFSGGSAAMRTLEQDDKDGICFLYGSFTQGKPCDSCDSDSNCKSGYCLEYPDGLLFCGQDCTSNASCPQGFYCYDIQNGTDQCVANNSYCSQTGSNIAVGNYCYGHETCQSGLCLVLPDTAYCSKECSADAQCPSPMKCISDYCIKGGSTALGGSCLSHMDCVSGLCLAVSESSGVCTAECETLSDCPAGFGCIGSYCFKGGDKKYGTPCTANLDCETGACMTLSGGSKICSSECQDKSDCPANNPCTYAVCIPPGNTPFGADCKTHTDCVTGLCGGSSVKICTQFCEADSGCPANYMCATGGFCVKKQAVTGQCQAPDDCPSNEFCKRGSAAEIGTCTPDCNPLADLGCADGEACLWSYYAWEGIVHGECVPSNAGKQKGEACDFLSAPCVPSLVCINVGGLGPRCYGDCMVEDGFGCTLHEQCLSLGLSSDPKHGVCVCADASCAMPGPDVVPGPDESSQPDDDATVQPQPDLPARQGDDRTPAREPDGSQTDKEGSDSGCSAGAGLAGSGVPASGLLLGLALLLLVAARARRNRRLPA